MKFTPPQRRLQATRKQVQEALKADGAKYIESPKGRKFLLLTDNQLEQVTNTGDFKQNTTKDAKYGSLTFATA